MKAGKSMKISTIDSQQEEWNEIWHSLSARVLKSSDTCRPYRVYRKVVPGAYENQLVFSIKHK